MHTDTVKEAVHPNGRENILRVLLEIVLFHILMTIHSFKVNATTCVVLRINVPVTINNDSPFCIS